MLFCRTRDGARAYSGDRFTVRYDSVLDEFEIVPAAKSKKRSDWESKFHENIQFMPGHNACWKWIGLRDEDGYGRHTVDSRAHRAHVVSYAMYRGPVPNDMFVLHHCDNTWCVRPEHLYLGTHHDNMADMMRRGRHRSHDPKVDAKIVKLYRLGLEIHQIASRCGVRSGTVRNALKRNCVTLRTY